MPAHVSQQYSLSAGITYIVYRDSTITDHGCSRYASEESITSLVHSHAHLYFVRSMHSSSLLTKNAMPACVSGKGVAMLDIVPISDLFRSSLEHSFRPPRRSTRTRLHGCVSSVISPRMILADLLLSFQDIESEPIGDACSPASADAKSETVADSNHVGTSLSKLLPAPPEERAPRSTSNVDQSIIDQYYEVSCNFHA